MGCIFAESACGHNCAIFIDAMTIPQPRRTLTVVPLSFLDLTIIALVLLILAGAISVVLGFFRSPFIPSNRATVDRMLSVAQIQPRERVVDLGAGDGRIVFAAARMGADAVGYEISFFVWLIALMRKVLTRSSGVIYRRSLFDADLRQADVVFCYLLPSAMARLAPKFTAELPRGARIISASFHLPMWMVYREYPAGGGAKRIFEYRKD